MNSTDTRTVQQSLDGETDLNRVGCHMSGICSKPATHMVEAFVYDGGGWIYKDMPACDLCTDEFLEHPGKIRGEHTRRLKACERWSA